MTIYRDLLKAARERQNTAGLEVLKDVLGMADDDSELAQVIKQLLPKMVESMAQRFDLIEARVDEIESRYLSVLEKLATRAP